MTNKLWDRVKSIFADAAELPADQRTAFLEEACTGNEELRAHVDALLEAHEEAGEFFSEPTQGDRVPDDQTRTLHMQAIAPKIGTRIGRYKLLELIGEGGFGTVYMAEQQEPMRRMVALKIIKLGMDTKQVIARFEAERQAQAWITRVSQKCSTPEPQKPDGLIS